MPSPEERIKKYYAEESAGIPKNRRMNGIPVRHKHKNAMVFYYIEGAGQSELNTKIRNRTRTIIEKEELDTELLHCDFAESFFDGDYHNLTVEWWTSLSLRQAILSYRQIIRRVMRIKKTKRTNTKYEFHVLVGPFV